MDEGSEIAGSTCISKWNNFRAKLEVGSGWKFFYTILTPVVWCWIPFVMKDDKLFGSHLYLLIMVSSLFVAHAMPLVISSMAIWVFLPLLGLQKAKMAGENIMREQAILILGQMALGCAFVISNLHKRIALNILSHTGNAHPRIVTVIYFLTFILSMIISGPTAAFVMLATTQSLSNEREHLHQRADELVDDTKMINFDTIQTSSTNVPESASDFPDENPAGITSEDPLLIENENVDEVDKPTDVAEKKEPESLEPPPDSNDRIRNLDKELKRRYFIIIYVAANIGGLLLPHTSPGVNLFYDYTDSRGRSITWGRSDTGGEKTTVSARIMIGQKIVEMNVLHWIQFAAPIIFILGLIAWIYLLIIFVSIAPIEPNSDRRLIGRRHEAEMDLLREEKTFYKGKLSNMGKTDIHQILVLLFTTCIVILWITRDPRFFDGWSRIIQGKILSKASNVCLEGLLSLKGIVKVGDSSAVFIFIVLMFMIPRFKNKPSDPKPLAVLGWKFLEGQIFWNVVIMFGCQFAFSQSSLTSYTTLFPGTVNSTTNCTMIPQTEHGGFRMTIQGWIHNIFNSQLPITWILVGIVALASELFGGVATSNIFLCILSQKQAVPYFQKGAKKVTLLKTTKAGVGHLGLPVTAMSCLSFMFPASTATNAIVFSLGTLTGCLGMLDMITYGAFLDLIAWALVCGRYEIYTRLGV
ncbi:unnamed protein product [Allacma fusca]|uniref:Uncharacterized protein n=1 Tax=Allacma fusca TaxID=39272 RepID=A0A8J2KMD3_9HEXA|nr:unnamed protein product [Allacma fusca]